MLLFLSCGLVLCLSVPTGGREGSVCNNVPCTLEQEYLIPLASYAGGCLAAADQGIDQVKSLEVP